MLSLLMLAASGAALAYETFKVRPAVAVVALAVVVGVLSAVAYAERSDA